ncbi:hypothetical protein ABZ816_38985 [Actinosynnema sp. NPDC047251]|nr:hypothetical protein [Saccharothrix espanaensis]
MKSENHTVSNTGHATASGDSSIGNTGYLKIVKTSIVFHVRELIKFHVVIPLKGGAADDRLAPPLADVPGVEASDPSESVHRVTVSPKVLLAALLAAIALIVLSCLPDPDDKFTEDAGERPVGATDDAVRTAVRNAITDCAKAVVPAPANCPQSEAVVSGESVAWSMHGDPVDGLQSAWREDRFNVRGNAVMSINYQEAWGEKTKTRVVGYSAEVFWRDGKASVSPITRLPVPVKTVRKITPDVSLDEVRPLVKSVFDDCAKAGRLPFPARCPEVNLGSGGRASWTFSGDPLVNARMAFDESSGLLHVTGSFASEIEYEVPIFGSVKYPLSGDFDALVAVDDGRPLVLEVRKT